MIEATSTPLVNLESQLASIGNTLRRVLHTRGGNFLMIGGARGVGKSRLATAVGEKCEGEGMQVVSTQCLGRGAEPLLPIKEALQSYFGKTPESIRDVILRAAPVLLDEVPFVGRFLSRIGDELATGPKLGGEHPRGLYDALAQVLLEIGRHPGLCLIIHDLHLADEDTLYFLNYFVIKSKTSPTLTIATAPEGEWERPPLGDLFADWRAQGHDLLPLPPLNRVHAARFVSALFEGARPEHSTLQLLYKFTSGNPLFVAETVRLLVEAGHLSVREGAIHYDGAPLTVPPRIDFLLQHRIQRVTGPAFTFLQVAAVIAETTQELQPISHLLGVTEEEAYSLLATLTRVHLLIEQPDARLTFESELLRMAVSSGISVNYRHLLHRRAGEWFANERRFSEAAHHFQRAGDKDRMLDAALKAADTAEHAGMYATAVRWYRTAQPLAHSSDVDRRLIKALIVVGEWDEAATLVAGLDEDDPQTALVKSHLYFVRGHVRAAAEWALVATDAAGVSYLDVLVRLAEIHLYLGEFPASADYARQALNLAVAKGSPNDEALCLDLLGGTYLFAGDVDQASINYRKGVDLLEPLPDHQRDVTVYGALLGNMGFVREIKNQWAEATEWHSRALRLRREVADARGTMQSYHALGKVALARGNLSVAKTYLIKALRLAADLGEQLHQGKVAHSLGDLAQVRGNHAKAKAIVQHARKVYQKCGTAYDVAHADLSLADFLEGEAEREAIECRARGRAAVEKKGFGLLRKLFPAIADPLAEKILGGLVAYAAGDALGLPWEGEHPSQIDPAVVESLPKRGDWPPGSTSDDTALTLLVGEYLIQEQGVGNPLDFMELVSNRADSIRGMGPSTSKAVQYFRDTHSLYEGKSNTNGAPMKALPIGWALPLSAAEDRRKWTLALSSATHGGGDALCSACVVAACASWALEGLSPRLLVEVALEEARAIAPSVCQTGSDVVATLEAVKEDAWTPPADGISLDPAPTLGAVLYCCLRSRDSLRESLLMAVSLGGDTDTVAALVGGLLGCRKGIAAVERELPWLSRVDLPDRERLASIASGLAAIRIRHYG